MHLYYNYYPAVTEAGQYPKCRLQVKGMVGLANQKLQSRVGFNPMAAKAFQKILE